MVRESADKSVSYNKQTTPFKLRNFVTYSFTEDFHTMHNIDDEFWISEISESTNDFKITRKVQMCEGEKRVYKTFYPQKSPDSFYSRVDAMYFE